MSTFEIVSYSDSLPDIKLDLSVPSCAMNYMGHMGRDGSLALKHAAEWANDITCSGDIHASLQAFFNYAKEKYFFPDQDSVWVTLRHQTSNENHKVLRPHHDGLFWSPMLNAGREQFKVGTVLSGPGTLFWSTDGMNKEKAMEVQQIANIGKSDKAKELGYHIPASYETVNEWKADKLKELEVPIVTVKQGQCVRWVVGDKERAAIHSEPDMSDMPEGRLFVMMLPGTEEQIKDLAEGWENPFHVEGIEGQEGT